MKSIFQYSLFVAAVMFCGLASAAETTAFDPAARAKAVAPFLEDRTIAVVHVDFTRIDIAATLDQIGELAPEAKPQLALMQAAGTAMQAAFVQSGGKDAYICLTVAGPLLTLNHGQEPFYFVLPLSSQANEAVLGGMIRQLNPKKLVVEQVGDVLLAGTRTTVDRLKALTPEDRAGLLPRVEKAFEAAGDTAAQVLFLPPPYTGRVVAEMMPTLPEVFGGGPSAVLTEGLHWASVGVSLPPALSIRAVIQSQDAPAATAFRQKLLDFAKIAAAEKDVQKNLPTFDKMVQVLTPEVQGDRLVLTLDEANHGVAALIDAVKPAVTAARHSAKRAQSINNLKQIALAMHNYHDAHNAFPPAAICDAQGKPLLSWRVLVLKYIDDKLYKEFHLDEPWDSEHNKKLIDRMPAVYRSPATKLKDKGRTNYVVATGAGTVFDGPKGTPIKEIKDGTSVTIMAVEVNDDHAVIWTKPDDLPFDPKQPNKALGGMWEDQRFLTAFCDGAVHALKKAMDTETLRNLFLRDDHHVVDLSK